MNKFANIYDIDGQVLRSADKHGPLTIDEAKKRIDDYQEKLKKAIEDGDDFKCGVYNTYIRNLSAYVQQYILAHPDLLKDLLQRNQTTTEQINDALEDIKADIEQNNDEYT